MPISAFPGSFSSLRSGEICGVVISPSLFSGVCGLSNGGNSSDVAEENVAELVALSPLILSISSPTRAVFFRRLTTRCFFFLPCDF